MFCNAVLHYIVDVIQACEAVLPLFFSLEKKKKSK